MKHAAVGKYWSVPDDWYGQTCFILAGGASMMGFEPEMIRGLGRVIVINDSFLLMPDADVLYFPDTRWWRVWRSQVTHCFTGQVVTLEHPKLEACRSLKHGGQTGLSREPDTLCGNNAGYQAINLAVLFGAHRIVLLGFDMCSIEGRFHWNSNGHRFGETAGAYEAKLRQSFVPLFRYLVKPLGDLNIPVWNCSPRSALPYWPKYHLSQVTAKLRQEASLLNVI